MREAARLQSFDDAFTFHTSDDPKSPTQNIGVGLDMIGEAVPPLLARAIAETVAVHLSCFAEHLFDLLSDAAGFAVVVVAEELGDVLDDYYFGF